MSHADAIRDAERAVVECAVALDAKARELLAIQCLRPHVVQPVYDAISSETAQACEKTEIAAEALLALRAETCHDCGGTAFVDSFGPPSERQRPIPHTAYRHSKSVCPSCTNGRKVAQEEDPNAPPDWCYCNGNTTCEGHRA
jgi:hypothetical protein